MRDTFDFSEMEPDIVALVLQKVIALAPGFSAALAAQIEREVKEQHGGKRLFVPKGKRRMTPQERGAVYEDGLTGMSTDEVTQKHNIHRATLYRVMKSGGGRFGG